MNKLSKKFSSFSPLKFSSENLVKILFAAVIIVFAFQLYFHITRTSATIDEIPHLLAGHRHLQCGDYGINPEHPPLLKILAAAPLTFRSLTEPPWECGSRITDKYDALRGGFFFLADNGIDSILIPARLAASLMSILLITTVFFAAKKMFGKRASVIAIILLAFEPVLIAHGSLITTDTALSAGLFLSVYALYCFQNNPSRLNVIFLGVSTGICLAVKHSGLIIIPLLFLTAAADAYFSKADPKSKFLQKRLAKTLPSLTAALIISFVILWASYGFRYYSLPGVSRNTVSVTDYIKASPKPEFHDSVGGKIIRLCYRNRLLPESYLYGLTDVSVNMRRPMFLLGENYSEGKWFFFPAAFSIKTNIPLLILLPLGLFTLLLQKRLRRELFYMLVPASVFFAVSMSSEMTMGIRHILPVYPFFIVIAAGGCSLLSEKSRLFGGILVFLLFFQIFTSLKTAPDYISFSNLLWGGSNNTYNLLGDSNLDWGQNLKIVNKYTEDNNIKDCWIAAFGGGELSLIQQPCRLMPGAYAWDVTKNPVDALPPEIEGTVFLTASLLKSGLYADIIQFPPMDIIGGGSIFVYKGKFHIPKASILSYTERARKLIQQERFQEAIEDSRKAVEADSADPNSHMVLATALKLNKQIAEAEKEFEEAARLSRIGTGNEAVLKQSLQESEKIKQSGSVDSLK